MNKVQKKRLLNVAKALREVKGPTKRLFDMRKYVYSSTQYVDGTFERIDPNICGTPSCALGHYAARRDLQKHFSIEKRYSGGDYYVTSVTTSFALGSPSEMTDGDLAYFGISTEEWFHIFGEFGCDRAQTPIQAARYIERFVKSKT